MFLGQLPELAETQAGKDLIRIGVDRAIFLLLEKKFGSVPGSVRGKIADLDLKDAEAALGLIDEWETIDELEQWLSANGKASGVDS